jgi:hypothetical protein
MSIAAEGYSLKDPTDYSVRRPQPFELGQVESVTPLRPESLGLSEELTPAEVYICRVSDPHLQYLEATNPGRIEQIEFEEAGMDRYAGLRLDVGKWERRAGTAYEDENGVVAHKKRFEYGDPVSREAFFSPTGFLSDPALIEWRKTVPSAVALLPLADPHNIEYVTSRRGERIEPGSLAREWFAACIDGQEIRNRGAIMAAEARDFLLKYAEQHPDERIDMLSVASGTALPMIQAAINSGLDSNIRLTLLEKDPKSQAMAKELADRLGFRGELAIREVDVFDPVAMDELAEELERTDSKAAFTDAMGIFEYSDPALQDPNSEPSDYMLFHPDLFLKRIMNLTKAGGRIHFGQMYSGRPKQNFTFGVVSWPYVCMRSPTEVMTIIRDAGGDLARTRLGMTSKRLYMNVTLDKAPVQVESLPFQDQRIARHQNWLRRAVAGPLLNRLTHGSGKHDLIA